MSNPTYTTCRHELLRLVSNSTDKLVLGYIDSFGGSTYAAQGTIAGQLGLQKSTLRAALDRLEKAGWITKEPRDRDDGSTASNTYALSDKTKAATNFAPPCLNPAPPHAGNRHPPMPESGTRDKDTSYKDNPDKEYIAHFEDFWSRYPRKVGKRKAESAYRSALKRGRKPGELSVALGAHCLSWKASETDTEFIPHASTWLNADRADDVPSNGAAESHQPEVPWEQRVEKWRQTKFWRPTFWGPPPGEPGCQVPWLATGEKF